MRLRSTLIGGLSLIAAMAWTTPALAHCDTLDGPVIAAARNALDTGNVDLVLIWVQKNDEADIRGAFQKTRNVRKAGGEVKDLADAYFFETLVRIHRAGEGAPYTGLKPAGQIEPPVAAADKAIETGKLRPLAKLVTARVESGLHHHFDAVTAKKRYNAADIEAGRAFTDAYVEFVHYAERLYDAAETTTADRTQEPAPAHTH
ncbi:MAG TPA: DUF6448 family protein [Burkholderiaceae bacterium]|nr:DUF6448 family protein [Burkholderiaceae bacterium]